MIPIPINTVMRAKLRVSFRRPALILCPTSVGGIRNPVTGHIAKALGGDGKRVGSDGEDT